MPTPNFEDAPDGSSSINHTGSTLSEDSRVFWEDIDPWAEIQPYPPTETPYPEGVTRWPAPPHQSYADGSAPAVNPLPNLNTAIGASHVATNPNRRIEARMFSQGEVPFPMNAGDTIRRPQTATEVNDEQMRSINPEWRPIPARSPDAVGAVPPNPVGYSRDFLPPCSPPRQSPRRTATEELREALSAPPRRRRRGSSDSDATIRKDPNAWSLREAVELCKLLEVVLPEAGFHIALTGGLLYKEGRRKDCDLMFYQIRGVEPKYEVLWKYLTVAGVIRSPSYPENGWLVKATYRGKQIDCLFPNAKKAKKVGAAPIIYHRIPDDLEEFLASNDPAPVAPASRRESERIAAAIAADLGIASGIPAVERGPYDPAELLATPAPAPVHPAVEAARIVESAASPFISPPVPQDEIPF